MKDNAKRESSVNAAESKTLSMRGSSMRENRETPAMPSAGGGVGRPEKAASPTSGMHVAGESDDLIVPTKRANKAGPMAVAESVEGRGSTKGNARRCVTRRTQSRVPWTAPPDVRGGRPCGSTVRPEVGAV